MEEIVNETSVGMGLIEQYQAGGFFMHVIALVGILSVIISIERFVTLYLRTRFNKEQIGTEVRNAIYAGNLSILGNTMIHKIVQAGFQAFQRSKSDSEVQIAIDAAASKYFPTLEKRTAYLATIANIATLLGLLGTISGLIMSFEGAGRADAEEKAALLASGISAAMNCTAFGLIVAIPTLLIFAFLQGRTQTLIDDVNEVVLDAMNFVVTHKEKLSK